MLVDLSLKFENVFNYLMDIKTENINLEIRNKIVVIYNILKQTFEADSFSLELKDFVMFLVYYNFLFNQEYLAKKEKFHVVKCNFYEFYKTF
ncbi:hypothetical protein NUSPORA_02181 [Nucleospora cyclopteri]